MAGVYSAFRRYMVACIAAGGVKGCGVKS